MRYLLDAETGLGRVRTLVAAFAYVPEQGRHRSIEQLEVEGDIKRQLYSVSTPVVENPNVREYAGGDQVLTFTDGQVELLRQRIIEFPFWSPLLADVVAETYRWLGKGEV